MPLSKINGKLLHFVHIPKTGGSCITSYLRAKGPVALYSREGVVTLTRRLFKLACRSLIKGQLPRISTPRNFRADGSGWCERTDGGLGQRNDCGLRTA